MTVQRTAVNPVTWSMAMGFNQGEVVSGHTRTLYCSGQTAMSGEGLTNLVRLNVYTTDVDLLLPHYGVLASRLGAAGVAPATTMLGVTRLAIPGQLVELEGTAVA